ncbi:UvrD-helicase domain-containing protein [Flavobacteriales bacterium]|nr:UvrD-helicase domain-containing protein [Flavobacteriales bacterium]
MARNVREGQFFIVRASAGSGKTFRLVQDYLTCCLRHDDPHYFRRILAITFTNKAAQEMKDRIMQDVVAVSLGEGSMWETLIADPSGENAAAHLTLPPGEIQRRARMLSEAMLHRYEDFSVMTIDSFVNRLVRSFSRDLKWDEEFQIELDEDALVEAAVTRVLDRVGRPGEEALTRLLEGFVRQQVEEERNAQLKSQLVKFGKQVTKENMQVALNALDSEIWHPKRLDEYRKAIRKTLAAQRKEVVGKARTALQAIEDQGLDPSDFYYSDLPKWLARVAKGAGRKPPMSNRLSGQIESQEFFKKNAASDVIQRIEGILPDALQAVEAWQTLYEGESGAKFKLFEHLQERVSLIGVLGLIRTELDAVQEERNVRLLSTLNREIATIVRENPAAYIYERIGNRYQHIFIDEFQDTSITQWHNLVQLFEHILSTGNMGMVVGDGKQAIYRWRNGNYEQLEALPKLIGEPGSVLEMAATTLERTEQSVTLGKNFRSGSAIVDWNNRWFTKIQESLPEGLKSVYQGLRQDAAKSFLGQVVVRSLVEKDSDERMAQRHRWVLDRILAHTGGSLSESSGKRTFVPSQDPSAFGLKDVAVLMRRNRDGALLAQYLLDHGVTPWTSESLHLGRHPAPRGVVAAMRMAMEPEDPKHVIEFTQCFCAIHKEHNEARILQAHLDERTYQDSEGRSFVKHELKTTDLMEAIAPLLQMKQHASEPLTTVVGHCFESLGWGRMFPAYAEGMLEAAQELSVQRNGTVRTFLDWWDRKGDKRSIRVSGGNDAVQIMTPHKAKGLAFPVVIAPVIDSDFTKFKDELPVLLDASEYGLPAALLRDSDLKDTPLNAIREEEIGRTQLDAFNIAYVAMTRAIERLDVLLEFKSEPEETATTKGLSHALWKAWKEEFSEAFQDSALSVHGQLDRKSSEEAASPDEPIERLNPKLVLGQSYEQLVARPKAHWSEPLPAGEMSPRDFGNAVHGVLSEVVVREDWGAVKERLMRTALLAPEHRSIIANSAENVLHHPEMQRFFDVPHAHVFAERALRLSAEKVGRPDRVVQLDGVWHVIDYKTGQPKSKHAEQVRNYCDALAGDSATHNVCGWVFYTSEMRLEQVLD